MNSRCAKMSLLLVAGSLIAITGCASQSNVTSSTTTSVSNASMVSTSPVPSVPVPTAALASRQWMLAAQDVVKLRKPSPPASARIYAYVATGYDQTLRATNDTKQSGRVSLEVLTALSPDDKDMLSSVGAKLGVAETLVPAAASVRDGLLKRMVGDGAAADAAADKTPPVGDDKWISRGGQVPLAVTAGTWTRWLVPNGTVFDVPAPPAPGSVTMNAQVQATSKAALDRDARWVATINYWGGTPGTEAPAGIWQNHFWKNIEGTKLAGDDAQFAQVQAALAMSLADSFLETWKIKYRYWTARPDMIDPLIKTSMPNPPFPGYVSGHSTVSAAAATVLSHFVPDKAALWMSSAEEARDSRLYAGIHLPIDNSEGFKLGQAVGRAILKVPTMVPAAPTPAPTAAPKPVAPVVAATIGTGKYELVPRASAPGAPTANLYRVSKVGYDKSFLVATDKMSTLLAGWTATKLHSSSVWMPGACSSNPSVVVGDRFEVFLEWQDSSTSINIYDTQTGSLSTTIVAPRSGMPFEVDDHTVATVVTSESALPFTRYIDLRNGSYVDKSIPGFAPNPDGDDSFVIRNGVVLAGEWESVTDNVRQERELNADDEAVYVDTKSGKVRAEIFGWRQPNNVGWDAGHGYFEARVDKVNGVYGPGVYDTTTSTWDWVFAETSNNYVLLGTIAT